MLLDRGCRCLLEEKNYLVLERLTPLSDKQITNKLDVDRTHCTSNVEQGGNVYQIRGTI